MTFPAHLPSPLESRKIFGRNVLVKRDDLLGPINGNKARKLHEIMSMPRENLDTVVSFGGNQSNAMAALSLVCRQKSWNFIYFSPPLPSWLKKSPTGNLRTALDNGMLLAEVHRSQLRERALEAAWSDRCLFVPQGAAYPGAETGIRLLADEIKTTPKASPSQHDILVSSGTGTTAFYLARHLPGFRILTYPCIGDEFYLREQMEALGQVPENLHIAVPASKISFGKPRRQFLEIYNELLESGIEFDLLYDCVFLEWVNSRWKAGSSVLPAEKKILFIHSGGLEGNPGLLQRYRRELKLN